MKNKDRLEQYYKTRDEGLRNELVSEYIYLSEIYAKKYANKNVEYDDLFQVASLSLINALERFNPSKGVEFTTFAGPTIVGDIKKYFRDKTWGVKLPRRMKELGLMVSKGEQSLAVKLGRMPTRQELSEYLKISEEEVARGFEALIGGSVYSLDKDFDNEEEDSTNIAMQKALSVEDMGIVRQEYKEIIEAVIEDLNAAERNVFKRRFMEEKTQREIAEEMGISQMSVSRIEKNMQKKFLNEYHKEAV